MAQHNCSELATPHQVDQGHLLIGEMESLERKSKKAVRAAGMVFVVGNLILLVAMSPLRRHGPTVAADRFVVEGPDGQTRLVFGKAIGPDGYMRYGLFG